MFNELPNSLDNGPDALLLATTFVFANEEGDIELVRRINGQFVTVTLHSSDTAFITLGTLVHEAEQSLR